PRARADDEPCRGDMPDLPSRGEPADVARAVDSGDGADRGRGFGDARLSRTARALLRPRGLRLRRADAGYRGVPAGARREVRRGVRDPAAQRGAVPDLVEPRDLPR